MGGNQEDSRIGQGTVVFVEPFVELYEFYHEAVIGTSDRPLLLDKLLGLLVVVAHLEDDVGDSDGHRPGDALDAMDQNVLFVLSAVLNEVDRPVEEAFDILVLGVFQEESQIAQTLVLEPVLAVIPSTVYNCFYPVLLEKLPTFGHLFSRHENTL